MPSFRTRSSPATARRTAKQRLTCEDRHLLGLAESTLRAQGYRRTARPIGRGDGAVYRIVRSPRDWTVEWFEREDAPPARRRRGPDPAAYIRESLAAAGLAEAFPTTEAARAYLEARRWPQGVKCPACGGDRITPRRGGFYRCNACPVDFTVRTGTVLERSRVPLRTWLFAMYLLAALRRPLPSSHLGRALGLTQKSAWYLLYRLEKAGAPWATS